MNSRRGRGVRAVALVGISTLCLGIVVACGGGGGGGSGGNQSLISSSGRTFGDTALVSNKSEVVATAATIDANLQNPWGIAVAPGLPFWISDNNSNLLTLYSGAGVQETQTITGSAKTGIAIPASAAGVQARIRARQIRLVSQWQVPSRETDPTTRPQVGLQ
jgi:hypothetical protein